MKPFDDLPQRSKTHDISEAAENAFRSAVQSCDFFVVQREDRNDYGTDFQIEARSGSAMTNIRAHVQLKGTESAPNIDGSIGIAVARTNLNYLLAQADSIYICYHLPSNRLLARYAEDILHEYEHRGNGKWLKQETITIKFTQLFDGKFQSRLNARILSSGRASRDRRHEWILTPPEKIPVLVQCHPLPVEVPSDPARASAILLKLYEAGQDSVISNSFAQFEAVLDAVPGAMDWAYMAEINLGINGSPCNEQRILQSIQVLQDAMERGRAFRGSLLYCQGNARLALSEYQAALEVYEEALDYLENPKLQDIAAQCNKNMGSAFAALGNADKARACYERALELDPDLGEAQYALALWHRRRGSSPSLVLNHLDQVIRRGASALKMSSVRGWRVAMLFETGAVEAAFRDINGLIGESNRPDWVWSWCARHVSQFGNSSPEVAQKALRFWRAYLQVHPDDMSAERERLLCIWRIRTSGFPTEMDFDSFKIAVARLIEGGVSNPSFLWDRIGHWAQYEEKWKQAENAYREAYKMEPERYGYCLGTALNFLDNHAEALTILLPQAEEHLPDAMSWFQLAVAYKGVGNIEKCISAYEHALSLDSDYELAWFNLGGIYWNSGDEDNATIIWRKAVGRFPNHHLAQKLLLDLPQIFEAAHN